MAMIGGVDPATLADAAIKQGYYQPDKDLPARALDGQRGPLVWDQNVPAKKGESFTFPKVWHAGQGRVVDLEFVCRRWDDYLSLKDATRLINAAILQGRHVVSGSFEHSVLIAGLSDHGPLVWDPDMERDSGAARRRLQAMVEGGLSLRVWPNARRCASSPWWSMSCGRAVDVMWRGASAEDFADQWCERWVVGVCSGQPAFCGTSFTCSSHPTASA